MASKNTNAKGGKAAAKEELAAGGKVTRAKTRVQADTPAAAEAAPKASRKRAESTEQTEKAPRSTINEHAGAIAKALKSKDGASVNALKEELGICRKSVRKLIEEAGGTRDGNVWRAA